MQGQTQFWFQMGVRRRVERELFGLWQKEIFVRDSDFSLNPRKTTDLKANSAATSNCRGVKESGASRAQQQTGQARLLGVTGNTPVMAVTTKQQLVCEGAHIAQEHVERNTAVEVLQLHHVGGMKSTGSTVQGYLSSGTAVDLTWLLVCERCEAAVCYSCTSRT